MTITQKTTDVLIQHAYKNVWSLLDGEHQINIIPARLTLAAGVFGKFDHMWTVLGLPHVTDPFHIFNMGQISISDFNKTNITSNTWTRATELSGKDKIFIEITTSTGHVVPKSECYFRMSKNRNVLLCINIRNKNIFDFLSTGKINVRIYTNSIYTRAIYDNLAPITYGGGVFNSIQDVTREQLNISNSIAEYRSGALVSTVNGLYVENITPLNAGAGDVYDWFFDTTIKRVMDYKLTGLPSFVSKNGKSKYILAHNEDVNVIEHVDDIDFYLVRKAGAKAYGIQISRTGSSITMLTHRDYAIDKEAIDRARAQLSDIMKAGEWLIRAFFRESSVVRPIIDEACRIKTLYRLPYMDRIECFAGLGPQVWEASNLEASGYVELMSADYRKVTRKMAQDAFGYHAISKILGNTPSKAVLRNGVLVVDVPLGLQSTCTGYEYSADGRLVGVSHNGFSSRYVCTSKEAATVELVFGRAHNMLDLTTNTNSGIFDSSFNYRFYRKTDSGFVDVTENRAITQIGSGTWSMAEQPERCFVLSNKRHLYRKQTIQPREGAMVVKLNHIVNGKYTDMPFHLGEYDVYFNGHPLVEGVEFYIAHPDIVITTKKYMKEGVENVVEVRGVNFCNSDMTHRKPEESGFVKSGMLSSNANFELRDDRVISIYSGGKYLTRDEVVMQEDASGLMMPVSYEGLPYAINHVIVPLNNILVGDEIGVDRTNEVRAIALAIDEQIGPYVTSKLIGDNATVGVSDFNVTEVYSPFFSRIIHDLEDGYIFDPRFNTGEDLSDGDVEFLVEHYMHYLPGDPTQVDQEDFKLYVKISPTLESRPFKLNQNQIKFLNMVVAKYGKGNIDVSGLVSE